MFVFFKRCSGGFLGLKEQKINKGQQGCVVSQKTLFQPEDTGSIMHVSTHLLCWSVLEQDTGLQTKHKINEAVTLLHQHVDPDLLVKWAQHNTGCPCGDQKYNNIIMLQILNTFSLI